MTKSQYRQFLTSRQAAIRPESSEDEAAAEYFGEIQSIINVIDKGGMFHKIQQAAEWVGEPFLMVEEAEFRSNLKTCSEMMASF